MERWNELMVAYVLGTLTPQERRDLSQMAAQNPQLMLDASRLRHMTSLQIAQKLDWPTEGFEIGAEGWADTATRSLKPALPEPIAVEPTAAAATTLDLDFPAEAPDLGSFWPRAVLAKGKMSLSKRVWYWLMIVALVCLGIDDWRVRRLLTMTQSEVLQMKMRTDKATWKD